MDNQTGNRKHLVNDYLLCQGWKVLPNSSSHERQDYEVVLTDAVQRRIQKAFRRRCAMSVRGPVRRGSKSACKGVHEGEGDQ